MTMRKRGLGRRAFLGGVGGITLALPMLELTHGTIWGQETTTPNRFLVVFAHGGEIIPVNRSGRRYDGTGSWHGQNWWKPADPGEALVLGRTHAGVLDEFTDDLVIATGIDNRACMAQADHGGGHKWANVTALTAADAVTSGEDKLPLGASIDQVLAARLAMRSPVAFPSIDLAVRGHQYGTPFFRAAREAVSSEGDPRAAFDRIFAGVSTGSAPDPELLRLRAMRRSVLDGVGEGLTLFRGRLGASDRRLLDSHLEHVRELERRLESLSGAGAECAPPAITSSGGARVIADLHCDIAIAALRCELTNVVTLNVADIITDWLPTPYGAPHNIGHSLHHAARDVGPTGAERGRYDDFFGEIGPNRQWRAGLVARLLAGLRDTPEGAGTMLDSSLLLYTSEFSAGADHSSADVPILLAGRAGGALRTGRHLNYNVREAADPSTLEYQTTASTHNVFTSILNAFGYDDDHFGSDHAPTRGPLPGLLG
ncbi:MAG: DUF1552 domain-containing protein [Myxococcota bacterium]|nr:DUF1552 domain-containing protein [Myxococcota bacterium]